MIWINTRAIAEAIKENRMFCYIGNPRQQQRTINMVQCDMRETS